MSTGSTAAGRDPVRCRVLPLVVRAIFLGDRSGESRVLRVESGLSSAQLLMRKGLEVISSSGKTGAASQGWRGLSHTVRSGHPLVMTPALLEHHSSLGTRDRGARA